MAPFKYDQSGGRLRHRLVPIIAFGNGSHAWLTADPLVGRLGGEPFRSDGQSEGQINRLKTIKHVMYESGSSSERACYAASIISTTQSKEDPNRA